MRSSPWKKKIQKIQKIVERQPKHSKEHERQTVSVFVLPLTTAPVLPPTEKFLTPIQALSKTESLTYPILVF